LFIMNRSAAVSREAFWYRARVVLAVPVYI
jgi:hypothetical protein